MMDLANRLSIANLSATGVALCTTTYNLVIVQGNLSGWWLKGAPSWEMPAMGVTITIVWFAVFFLTRAPRSVFRFQEAHRL